MSFQILSVKELADMLNVTTAQIYNYRNNPKNGWLFGDDIPQGFVKVPQVWLDNKLRSNSKELPRTESTLQVPIDNSIQEILKNQQVLLEQLVNERLQLPALNNQLSNAQEIIKQLREDKKEQNQKIDDLTKAIQELSNRFESSKGWRWPWQK